MKILLEKLKYSGITSLSDEELIFVISGLQDNKNNGKILEYIEKYGFNTRYLFNCRTGRSIAAAMELIRRRAIPEGGRIEKAEDLLPYLNAYANKKQEYFLAVTLNGANEVIAVRVVTIGLVNRTQIHPREIFVNAISDRACYVIAAHNHPSGNLEPSPEDISITRRLMESGEIIGIKLLDHIIFNQKGIRSAMPIALGGGL